MQCPMMIKHGFTLFLIANVVAWIAILCLGWL